MFGPIGHIGNQHAVYDTALAAWKTVVVPTIFRTSVNSCNVNHVPGQVLPSTGFNSWIISTFLNSAAAIELDFTSVTQGAFIDPDTGIKCAANSAGQNSRQPIVGHCKRHPTFGVQGQGNSEYLQGRNQLWSVGLEVVPSFASPFTFPSDNVPHAVGVPIDFVMWDDRLVGDVGADLVFFNSVAGASLTAFITVNGNEMGQHVGTNVCAIANTPIPVRVPMNFSGGRTIGYYSLQLHAMCNTGVAKLGFGYNSLFKAGTVYF